MLDMTLGPMVTVMILTNVVPEAYHIEDLTLKKLKSGFSFFPFKKLFFPLTF